MDFAMRQKGETMDDLISRQAAIEITKTFTESIDAKIIKKHLLALPSAQPEIIMCKDCKFYDGRPCGIVDWYNTADDFCSKGERRNNGEIL